MAKIAILDDYEALAKLTAGPLLVARHEVRIWTSSIDFEQVLNFGPDLIKIDLYRKESAYDRPIRNVEQDIIGIKPLMDLERYPAAQIIPILLVGIGVKEKDVPTHVNYDLFLTFPKDIDLFLPKVIELTQTAKTRRKISGYVCPNCHSRLTFTQIPILDLFCPRCHTAVVVINGTDCLYIKFGETVSSPCTMQQLEAPGQDEG